MELEHAEKAMLIRKLIQSVRDESGVTLVLVAGAAVVLLSVVALAVDVGMLNSARTDAQRVADAAALAGARTLSQFGPNVSLAKLAAEEVGELNDIQNELAQIDTAQDIVVDTDLSTVAVTVRRTEARGNPVGTFFARIFGVDAVNITAYAKAEAAEIPLAEAAADCLLPLAAPDRWSEEEGVVGVGVWPTVDDVYHGPEFDENGNLVEPDPDPDDGITDWYDATQTGYNQLVIGQQMFLHKGTGGGGDVNPSWYFPWVPTEDGDLGDPGAAAYENRFTTCLSVPLAVGDTVWTEPGAMVGPTRDGFGALFDEDPEAEWWDEDEGGPCVASFGQCVTFSERIRVMPLFDPRLPPQNGRSPFVVSNFIAVFIEGGGGTKGNPYVGRYLGLVNFEGGEEGGGDAEEEAPSASPGPTVTDIRLIE